MGSRFHPGVRRAACHILQGRAGGQTGCGPSHKQRMPQEWLLLPEARATHSWEQWGSVQHHTQDQGPQQKTPLNPISTPSWLGDPNEGLKCSGLQFLL